MAARPIYQSVIMTGGLGMLAHALGNALRERGVSFVSVDRGDCDITSPAAVQELFARCKPTLLLNCAAHTAVDLCEKDKDAAMAINGHAAGTLARLCREYGAKMVHYSTDFVFDGQIDRPYRPDDTPNPLSVYGASKLLGETQVQEANPPGWMIIRTAWLYGRSPTCFPQRIIELARSGKPLRVVDDQIGCPTYAVDLAAATLALIDCDAGGIYHVTNVSGCSWRDFAAGVLEEFGIAAPVAGISTAQWMEMRPDQAIRPAYSVLDVSRYTQTTGKKLRDWRDALRDYRIWCGKPPEFS